MTQPRKSLFAHSPPYPERLLESVDGLLLLGPALLPDHPLAGDHPAHRPLLATRRPRRGQPLTLPSAKDFQTWGQ